MADYTSGDKTNGVAGAKVVANSSGAPTRSDDQILQDAKKRLQMSIEAYDESRQSELDDLKFLAGSPDNQWQWPQAVLTARTTGNGSTINARPCLTINKLPQHVLMITNQQRQDRPSGKVIPVDDRADVEVAEVFEGVVRHIEYISDSDVVYNTACQNQVGLGEGYWRYITEYVDATSFDQEIKLQKIENIFSVQMDPTAQCPAGSDAQWCLITQDLTKDEFEHQFPNATPISQWGPMSVGDQGMSTWLTDQTVRIAEYFYIECVKKKLGLYPTVPGIVQGGSYLDDSMEAKAFSAMGIKPSRVRDTEVNQVKWCKVNGCEVLEKKDWAGKYIPVVRVLGNKYEVEGRVYLSGIVRNAKDAQRMYNYWTSQEAEMLALAPKAPFVGAAGQFEGFEDKWKQANIQNFPYLEYNHVVDEGLLVPAPQRLAPPLPQQGLIQAKLGASDDIKGTTGQYNPSLGADAQEKSGKAIVARQKQTDLGTFHYHDNFGVGLKQGTRILIDLVPKIYDTARIARIVGLDGDAQQVQLNPEQQEPVRVIKDEQTGAAIKKIYNLNVGKYDVAVEAGRGYATKRQEASESMGLLIQTNPEMWNIIGDLFVKGMDWPGAQEMAKRLRATIPPEVLAAGDGDEDTPRVAQLTKALDQQSQIVQAQQAMIENFRKSVEAQNAENEKNRVANEHFRADIEAYNANTTRMKSMLDALAKATGPDGSSAVLNQTIQQILAAPSLEEEEPIPLEQGEAHMQTGGMMPQMPQGGIQMEPQQPPGVM